jgi:broad specificity phosphatase PhoE
VKKHLILVKHSLPEIVENLPAREWKLSAEGRIRAQQLAERLRPFQPEYIISSLEPKAKETAEIIAGTYNLEFHIADDLHEHDRSKTPHLSKDDFQAAMHEFFEKSDKLVFGSETADEAYARFYQAVRSVLDCHPDEVIVIVSHGTVISLFVSRLIGISGLSLWNELGLPSFLVIDVESNMLVTRESFT